MRGDCGSPARASVYLRAPSTRPMLRSALARLAACLLCALAPAVAAQGISSDTPRRAVAPALAITDARVVVAPGQVLDRATVVVRDGRIEAVGAGAAVPFDARVIEGDSLTVYAAFVDAFGWAGIDKPDDPDDYEGDRDAPPPERAGITPGRDARELFDGTDGTVKALREAGFGAAHVVPRDGLFSGEGAVVLLRELGRAETSQSLALTPPLSAVLRIDAASGVYPTTPMSVLATQRELIENARRARAAADAPRTGLDRLRFEPTLDALMPVIDGDRRVFYAVGSALGGFRALRASGEMGLSPTLVGVPDAAPLLGKLRDGGLAFVAPLALPDTVKADSTARARALPTTTSPGGASFVSDRRTLSTTDLADERTTLVVQQRAAVRRAEASPAAVAGAGIPLAFGTLDVKPKDILPNVRRMIAAGLSERDALAALTTGPAAVLGLSDALGTVERGRLGNLLVTTGDVFSDSTAIRHVVIEGQLTTLDADGAPAGDPDAEVTAVGTWDLTVSTPGGDQTGAFTLTGSGSDLSGSVTIDGEEMPMTSVTLAGNSLTFVFTAPEVGDVTVTGIITDNELDGTASLSMGAFPLTATRRPE